MAIGIEIVGGGKNKISDSSIELTGTDSKGIVMLDTSENEVRNVRIFIESCAEKIKEMTDTIVNLEDDTVNPKSANTFKVDVVKTIPKISCASTELEIQSTGLALISLLSNWITIKSSLAPVLAPYIDYLLKLIPGN
ncbi:hypothetical protein HCY66_14915 [Acinetobacter radioresistens]|uniref:hypothetical protein n=1 Tax=Acinetobacter radioresistens TaxID=40216 RepID=UPI0020061A0F|nr:hypothetical protein [Acinetobacter radioresistens]MCK4091345.1 hypothetical protein [Acinetobacter radioresistens]